MPTLDPDELQEILGVDEDRATWLASITDLVIEATIYPNAIPDPVPAPIALVALQLAIQINSAKPTAAGAVVSESIGAYTYRLQRAQSLDLALRVPKDLLKELRDWAPAGRQGVYDIDLTGTDVEWPDDWWQRDLDTIQETV